MHLTTRNKMDKKLEAVMADILNKGRLDYWSQVGQRSWAVAATIAWTVSFVITIGRANVSVWHNLTINTNQSVHENRLVFTNILYF